MAPALALRRALSRAGGPQTRAKPPSICLFCSFSRPSPSSTASLLRSQIRPPTTLSRLLQLQQKQQQQQQRHESTTTPSNPRHDLARALADLQTHAANYTNLPRLQLALRNLSEPPGHESIRVAVLSAPAAATAAGGDSSATTATAKRLLRLALADPLRPAAAWEAELEAHDAGARPLIVRLAAGGGDGVGGGAGAGAGIRVGREQHVIPELRVEAPQLQGAELEMLVGGAGPVAGLGAGAVDDAVLVPTVDVAATTSGHVAPVGTPVHMALLVGDGVLGAASILSLPVVEGPEVIAGVVNFARIGREDLADCPLVAVNVDAASEGLELFRADVGNAMKYEALWSEGNVSRISEWLKKSALPGSGGATKEPVRRLIGSLLRNARAALQEEAARDLSADLRTRIPPGAAAHLDRALAEWAQNAHRELQQQLDVAFATRPWSKLGWWKLFWRADDVGMVTSEMVALRFLPRAEQDMIYLAGRIQEAGLVEGEQGQPVYSGPALPPSSIATQRQETAAPGAAGSWPQHIPFTRNYLLQKTVPALQALAQRLVVQSASLAGLSTALAGLSYLSAVGAYECGAIAALGIALSCRRLQQKWDAARGYWQGEVREEGRKAIRSAEISVAEVLDRAGKTPASPADERARSEELERLEEIITRAEAALERMK